jgi:diguanylate cyclase (GGDEF)-like protein
MSGIVIALLILNLLIGFVIGWVSSRLRDQQIRARTNRPTPRSTDTILAALTRDSARHSTQMRAFAEGLESTDSASHPTVNEMHRSNQQYEQQLNADRDDLKSVAPKSDVHLTAVLRNVMTLGGDARQLTNTLADHIDTALSDEAKAIISATVQQALNSVSQLESKLEVARQEIEQRETQLAQVTQQARTDQLTKLPNRRAFEEHLAGAHARFEQGQSGYAVIMLDLDNFKSINDTYSHSGGDAALGVFGHILRESVRNCDQPARMGGEEFAVLLSGADASTATFVAERCRGRLESTQIRSGNAVFHFTVSAGIAVVCPGDSPEQLLRKADEALYAAKAGGKNCTQRFADLKVNLDSPQLLCQGS